MRYSVNFMINLSSTFWFFLINVRKTNEKNKIQEQLFFLGKLNKKIWNIKSSGYFSVEEDLFSDKLIILNFLQ